MITAASLAITVIICLPVLWLGHGIASLFHIIRVNRRKGDE